MTCSTHRRAPPRTPARHAAANVSKFAGGVPERLRYLVAWMAVLIVLASAPAARAAAPPGVPSFTHVVEVMLENESAASTFEDPSAAPALAKLRRQGVYLPRFFGVGHSSLDNY